MKKLLVALLMVPAMAQAEFKTGNELLGNLRADSIVENMVALGYIMGIADSTRGVSQCGPADATAGQMKDMVRNYLEANPQIRHFTADLIVKSVLSQAWPCANRGRGA